MPSGLYLESTIPSYLAAHPSQDIIVAAHQHLTHRWWREARPYFDLYLSEAVLDEISQGDPQAAARRLSYAQELPILSITPEVGELAQVYLEELGLPERAVLDTIHLACVSVYEIPYLLTWNCKHLANGIIIDRLRRLNEKTRRWMPVIVTPEELMDHLESL